MTISALPTEKNVDKKKVVGLLFFSVAFLLLFALSSDAQSVRKATDYYNRGLEKQDKGDLEGASADYNQAIALEPRWHWLITTAQTSGSPRATSKARLLITAKR